MKQLMYIHYPLNPLNPLNPCTLLAKVHTLHTYLTVPIHKFVSPRVMEYACEAHGHLAPALEPRLHC